MTERDAWGNAPEKRDGWGNEIEQRDLWGNVIERPDAWWGRSQASSSPTADVDSFGPVSAPSYGGGFSQVGLPRGCLLYAALALVASFTIEIVASACIALIAAAFEAVSLAAPVALLNWLFFTGRILGALVAITLGIDWLRYWFGHRRSFTQSIARAALWTVVLTLIAALVAAVLSIWVVIAPPASQAPSAPTQAAPGQGAPSQGETGQGEQGEPPATPGQQAPPTALPGTPGAGSLGQAGAPCGSATVATTRANLRAEPDQRAAIVAKLPAGSQVTLLCDTPVEADGYTWVRVQTNDDPPLQGWVARELLREEQ